MDIEEIRQHKYLLESNITKLINEFEIKTQTEVLSLELEHIRSYVQGKVFVQDGAKVKIRIEI